MRLTILRNTFVAAVLFLSGIAGARATSALPLDTLGFLTPSDASVILPFTITDPGKYDLTLTDFGATTGGLYTTFDTLTALIAKPSAPTFNYLVTSPGTTSIGSGATLAAGSYFAVVSGILGTPATFPQGIYGISVAPSAVPLPPAALLLGSAFAGLVALGRRRKALSAS
jgi:hypothetical protein